MHNAKNRHFSRGHLNIRPSTDSFLLQKTPVRERMVALRNGKEQGTPSHIDLDIQQGECVVLTDEPTADLDAGAIDSLRQQILQIEKKKDGRSLLLNTDCISWWI